MKEETGHQHHVRGRTRRTAWLDAALAGGLFIISFLFYSFNLHWLSSTTFSSGRNVVGDVGQILPTMRDVTFKGDMRKHILFSASTAPLVRVLDGTLRIGQDEAIMFVLALIAALNIAGMLLVMRTVFRSRHSPFLFVFVFASCFYNLVLFSIPETYALSDLWIVLYLLVLLRLRERLNWRSSLGLSGLCGLASLYHPPLLSLVIVHIILISCRYEWAGRIKLAVANLVLAGSIFLSVNVLILPKFLRFALDYGEANLSKVPMPLLERIGTVLTNFFLYSILSPVGYVPHYLVLQDFAGYLKSPLGLALVPIAVGGVIWAIAKAITRRSEYRHVGMGLLAWMLVTIVFYVLYRPDTATLWSLHILSPLLLLLAIAFDEAPAPSHAKHGAMLFVSALIAIHNCIALYAGPLE